MLNDVEVGDQVTIQNGNLGVVTDVTTYSDSVKIVANWWGGGPNWFWVTKETGAVEPFGGTHYVKEVM